MIRAERLTKRYGSTTAVDDLTFEARPGEITVLIGRDGAGKSTTLRLLSGSESPSGGTVTVNGRRPGERRARGEKLPRSPETHLLDEPMRSLGLTEAIMLERALREWARLGHTVVLTSSPDDPAVNADHVIFLRDGRKIADGTTPQLLSAVPPMVTVTTAAPGSLLPALIQAGASVTATRNTLAIRGLTASRVAQLAAAQLAPVTDLTTSTPSLADAFLACAAGTAVS